jgi:hypothetical protein
MKYLNLGMCQKFEILSQKHAKKLRTLEMPIAIHLLLRLAYQIITLITAHTTLTSTCKLNGKTCVHTVFYEEESRHFLAVRVLVKDWHLHSSFHFGYSVSNFRHAELVYRLVSRARELKCGWVVIISTNSRCESLTQRTENAPLN